MTKVTSIFEKKEKVKEELDSEIKKESEELDPDFEEIMKKNEEKKQKLAKERAAANKGVLRSYRIK